ncbi:MAG: hypothetical protein JNJ54_29475 [Myxococcaceae bacterium]|nr:hypothetical protein [Myxococcaceae bacterium]
MMRPLLVAALLGAGLACSGLLTAPGNDFPCDFSKPPGARDAVCSPGDVCGVQNRCQRFKYEGPQFEGKPTFPFFSDAGAQLHPMVIKSRIEAVARVQGRGPERSDELVVHTSDSGSVRVTPTNVTPVSLTLPTELLEDIVLISRDEPGGDGGASPRVVGLAGNLNVFFEGAPRNGVRDGTRELSAARLRAFRDDPDAGFTLFAITPDGRGGRIDYAVEPPVFETLLTQPITPIDIGPGPFVRGRRRALVILATDGFRVPNETDGGTTLVLPATFQRPAVLSVDSSGSTFAVVSTQNGPVLSTWIATRTVTGVEVAAAWSDCRPCKRLVRSPLAVRAGRDLEGPFVDVLCEEEGFRRLRGTSSTSLESCSEEDANLPFDFSELASTRRRMLGVDVAVQDSADPTGFLAGGLHGQIWKGDTIGEARPLFLDRVPSDVQQVEASGVEGLLALTPVGVFRRPRNEALATRTNGFRAMAPERTRRVTAFVHDSRWVVLEGGHLAVFQGDDELGFGPRLVDGRGEPASRVLRGEGIAALDGGLVSMVVAADDSLYFVPAPARTELSPGLLGDLSMVLTPEPSSLIRSFALERTPIGTDGVSRVRGYVVTARSVYEFKLGGAPLRWTATPLPLSGGEPLEVWFDNPRGGLARAGYRDGTIFSIPGGFPLTEPLPANDAGIPAAVRDYENLGGWPFAYTSAGLFVARYDTLPDGKLDTRFPDGGLGKLMTWREVTLPDGSRPWMRTDGRRAEARPGTLFVVADPQTGTDTAYRRLFHLLVFLPDQVLEVAQHERTNISTRVE